MKFLFSGRKFFETFLKNSFSMSPQSPVAETFFSLDNFFECHQLYILVWSHQASAHFETEMIAQDIHLSQLSIFSPFIVQNIFQTFSPSSRPLKYFFNSLMTLIFSLFFSKTFFLLQLLSAHALPSPFHIAHVRSQYFFVLKGFFVEKLYSSMKSWKFFKIICVRSNQGKVSFFKVVNKSKKTLFLNLQENYLQLCFKFFFIFVTFYV